MTDDHSNCNYFKAGLDFQDGRASHEWGAWCLVDHQRMLSGIFGQQSIPIKIAMFNSKERVSQ